MTSAISTGSQKQIPFGTDLHAKIWREVWERYEFSRRYQSRKYDKWRRAEERYLMYRPEEAADKERRAARDAGKVQFVTLEVPYSYAMLLTAHTYWSTVFLGRNPVFQYTGRHGEAEQATQAVETLIDYHLNVGDMLPALYIWLLDVGKYGVGIVGSYWEENYATVSQFKEVPQTFMGIPVGDKTKIVRETVEQLQYMGNKLYNIRPYDFFPDPRVPLYNLQKGEFVGRYSYVSWNEIKRRESRGIYFNVAELENAMTAGDTWNREHGSSQVELPAGQRDYAGYEWGKSLRHFTKLLEMHIEVIPKLWGLHEGTSPEKWVFTMANDRFIIGAQPLGLLHNQFPFGILEYEIDGYAQLSRGMLELTNDLNDIMSWLFNSHMYNVRKVVNGMLVVDPSKVVMKDLTDDGAGKLIRVKPAAYGQDVRQFIQQLQVQDVTQNHMKDAQAVAEIMQRVLGVNDNIMGMLDQGGRKTATEVRSSTSFGVNRLKTNCEYFSATGFSRLSQMFVQNSQQLYDQDMIFKIAGQAMAMQSMKTMKITPQLISGFYDFVPVDGTMPVDRFAQASLWKEMIMGAAQLPMLAQRYDIAGMFGWAAQLGGLKNIKDFEIQPGQMPPGMQMNVVPDEQLQRSAAAGNVVPIGGSDGPARATRTGEMPGAQTGAAGAPYIRGVGPTG